STARTRAVLPAGRPAGGLPQPLRLRARKLPTTAPNRRRVEEGPEAVALALVDKAREVRRKAERLKRVGHEAQTREAVSRTELTGALHVSLIARAELAARLRHEAFEVFLMRARPGRLRRHNRLSRLVDKGLSRL